MYTDAAGVGGIEQAANEEATHDDVDMFEWSFVHSTVPKAITSPAGMARVNEAFCEMLGYTPGELGEATTWMRLTHPDDVAETQRQIDALISGEHAVARYEKRYLRKDGTVVWAEVHSSLRRDADAKPLYLATTVLDITERKAAADALRREEDVYRATFDHAPVGIAHVAPDGSWLRVNPALCDMLGYTPEEMQALTFADITHPDDVERTVGALKPFRDGSQEFYRTEKRYLRKDGAVVWVSLNVAAIRNEDGSLVYQVTVVQDNTERKHAENALREQEEKYRALFEDASDAVYVLAIAQDGPGRFLEVNDRACTTLGYTREELLAMETRQIDVPEMAARAPGVIAELKAKGFTVFETEHVARDGHRIPVEIAARMISVEGQPVILSAVRDNSQHKAAEALLARAVASITQVVSTVTEQRDPYTAGHQLRVSKLAKAIARKMGMREDEVDHIRIAALLHDVGKVSIPAEILSKPGALSPAEFELVKGHSEASFKIMTGANMEGDIAEVVYQHHERLDGSGYPRGLVRDQVLPGARVIMVADVVEAMCSHRPYRAALGVEGALAEIEDGAGSRYDADVARACVALFREGGFELSE